MKYYNLVKKKMKNLVRFLPEMGLTKCGERATVFLAILNETYIPRWYL